MPEADVKRLPPPFYPRARCVNWELRNSGSNGEENTLTAKLHEL